MEYFPAVQSSQTVSDVDVLAVLILVPAPHVVAEVHPTALMAVEYFPASHSVHTEVPPTEYFPAVQSSQMVSEVDVLAVLILVPAPQVVAVLQAASPISSEYLPGPLQLILTPPTHAKPISQITWAVRVVSVSPVV